MVNPDHSVPEMLAHRYRVIRVLGEGGFGTTYLAADTQMPSQKKCVVKQLKPMGDNPEIYQLVQERFQREAAILEMLGDKNEQIPRLYANFSEANHFYLVEEWIEGDTLSQKVIQDGALDEGAVRSLLLNILPALTYIHEHQIVHRDIKPDNILLRASDQLPVLIDFGAVKESLRTIVPSQAQPTQSIVVGTPGFMPSEQMAGYPVYSSDLFSLGLTAIYLLTGRMPQTLETDPRTGSLNWHPFAPTVSPACQTLLDRCIKMHAKERFQTAEEMRLALLSLTPTVEAAAAHFTEPTEVIYPLPLESTEVLYPQSGGPDPSQASPAQQPPSSSTKALGTPPPLPVQLAPPAHPKHRSGLIIVGLIGAAIAGGIGIVLSNLNPEPSPGPISQEPTSQEPPSISSTETQPDAPDPPSLSSPVSSPVAPASPITTTSPDEPPVPPPDSAPQWEYVGTAATGEDVSVNNYSLRREGSEVAFQYRIGRDQLNARADCPGNRWYADGFGWYNPQSEATQIMLDYVCSF